MFRTAFRAGGVRGYNACRQPPARPTSIGGFTLVELMVVVAIIGILASIAIPTFGLFIRRSKTSEARIQIAKMFDGTSSYFAVERVVDAGVTLIGDGANVAEFATHRCPAPDPAGGEAELTPPASVECHLGPSGRCIPSTAPSEAGYYHVSAWDGNLVWAGLRFEIEQGHYFHYNYVSQNATSGFGACQFTAAAFGDLDGDGQFSTFARGGAADQQGVNGSAGLLIERALE